MTALALFGSYDWHCLVTRQENHYEPGAFTCAGALPALTPPGEFIRSLASYQPVDHLLPEGNGWWHAGQ